MSRQYLSVLFIAGVLAAAPIAPLAAAGPKPDIRATVGDFDAGMTIYWSVPKDQEAAVKGFVVEYLDPALKTYAAVSDRLKPDARQYTDASVKGKAGSHTYRIVAIAANDARTPSVEFAGQMVNTPTPPLPAGLKAVYVREKGKRYIDMTWDPKSKSDNVTDGYQLYTDAAAKEGELWRQSGVLLIHAASYRLEVNPTSDRQVEVGISGMSSLNHEGPLAKVAVAVPGSVLPGVSTLKAAIAGPVSASKVTLTWEYPKSLALDGFQVYQNDKQVGDEKTLGPDARSWTSTAPLKAGSSPSFRVEPVSKSGATVMLGQPATAAVPGGAPVNVNPYAGLVTFLKGQWTKRDGHDGILLTWSKFPDTVQIKQYSLSADEAAIGDQGQPRPINPTSEGEYFYPVTGAPRSYHLELNVETPAGLKCVAGRINVLGPGAKFLPATLNPKPTPIPHGDKTALAYTWTYLSTSEMDQSLKGFRVYQNGVVVATENDLRVNKYPYEWISAPLAPGQYIFEIEAVGKDGSVSERGIARQYTVQKTPSR